MPAPSEPPIANYRSHRSGCPAGVRSGGGRRYSDVSVPADVWRGRGADIAEQGWALASTPLAPQGLQRAAEIQTCRVCRPEMVRITEATSTQIAGNLSSPLLYRPGATLAGTSATATGAIRRRRVSSDGANYRAHHQRLRNALEEPPAIPVLLPAGRAPRRHP